MELEHALDALYDATPDDFVAERKRLAKELKAAGHAEDAVELTKVRKPTVAAWALNRLARDHRRDVDLLLDSGHRMRTAQAGVLRGEAREAFEQAQHTERETIARLVRAAEQLLGGASSTVLEQVSGVVACRGGLGGRPGSARGRPVHATALARRLQRARWAGAASVEASAEAEAVSQHRGAEGSTCRACRGTEASA